MNNNMPIAAEPLSFTFAWRHLSGWWRSRDCWPGALSVLSLLLLIGLGNRVAVWQNDLSKLAMDATQLGDIATLMSNLGLTVLLMIVSAGFINLRQYAQGALLMPWRQWQTRHTLARWFAHRAFHRIERDGLVENADQRIADDLRLAIETTTALVFGLIGTLVMLVTFVPRLYAQSGPFSFAWGDGSVVIPGFMLWAAIAFALLLALLTHGAGHRLAATEALQESTEASLRFGLIRVRENAEQIAFYGGMDAERAALGNSFAAIVRVYWRLLFQRNLVGFVNLFVNNFDKILPALLFAPRIVGGQATLGDLMQVSMTFGMVVTQLTWFSRSYVELANWAGAFKRLSTLDRALRGSDAPGLERVASGGPRLATPGIELHRPDGSVMAHVPALAVGPGERVLLRGPSGVGKSTLLRALAGLWPFGAGRAEVPDAGMAMFLPQQPYLPLGTLAEVLSYPAAPQAFGAEQYRNALAAFGLSALADELEVETAWHLRLSPGEQQRVAAARVLLQRPQVLIIDEATSALDVASEQTVYRTLLERLPHLALLSVAHQPGAEAFHTRSVELTPPLPATPRTT